MYNFWAAAGTVAESRQHFKRGSKGMERLGRRERRLFDRAKTSWIGKAYGCLGRNGFYGNYDISSPLITWERYYEEIQDKLLLTGGKQHINNVIYTRFAESARVNWVRNYALYVDQKHKKEWSELMTPTGYGLILRSIRTDYKFVSLTGACGINDHANEDCDASL